MRSLVLCLMGLTLSLAVLGNAPTKADTAGAQLGVRGSTFPTGYKAGERNSVAVGRAALFVESFTSDNTIYVFNAQDDLVQKIALNLGKGQGSSLAVDQSGNLYVAPLGLSFVRIYAGPNYSSYSQLNLPKSSAVRSIAIDEHTGVLAVLRCNCAFGGGGKIYYYRPNTTVPCDVVDTPVFGDQAIFDREGTLFFFVEGDSQQSGYVASLAGECKASTVSQLSFQVPIYPYGTFAVNKDDNLVIQSFGSPPVLGNTKSLWPIYTYAHPRNNVFGLPLATTVLNEYGKSETQETFYAISGDGRHLWGEGFDNGLREFPYPKGGPAGHLINNVSGSLAVNPPLVP